VQEFGKKIIIDHSDAVNVSGPTLIGFFNDDISVIAVSDGYIIEFNGHYLYLNYALTIPTAF
jgi:hypothetical protein